jgi:hypothetical protein
MATARTKERREASDDPMKTVRDACKRQDGALYDRAEMSDGSELRPEEASAARVLRELIKNQRLG